MLIFVAMIAIVIVLGLFGIINASGLRVRKGLKNISVLRALGMKYSSFISHLFLSSLTMPCVAAITSFIPVYVYEEVRKYVYDYLYSGEADRLTAVVDKNGIPQFTWQQLFPLYIELSEQPVLAAVIITFIVVAAINIVANIFPARWLKKQSINDSIRNEKE